MLTDDDDDRDDDGEDTELHEDAPGVARTVVEMWNQGWGFGFMGWDAESMLRRAGREWGGLLPHERLALLTGHRVGAEDADNYRKDMAAMEPADLTGVPL